MAPNGTVVGSYDLSGEAGAIAIDRSSGTVWVCLASQGQVARVSTAGAVLGVTNVNQFGDWLTALVLDSKGHAWVGQRFSHRVAKLRPDGTVFGQFRAPLEVSTLLVDAQDNVLVASLHDGFRKLSPEGRWLATYDLKGVWDWAFDPAGALWVIGNSTYYSGGIYKVTL
ncbi:SMP-30/Gluconolaconase/LRE-like region [compost metagenome]